MSTPAPKKATLSSLTNKSDDKKDETATTTTTPDTDSLEKSQNEYHEYPPKEDNKKDTVVGLTDKDSVVKDDPDTNETSGLSNSVVHDTSTNKTPEELSSESADETAARYGITNEVSKEDIENPRVQVYADTVVKQVPSGTHLHPDVAKSLHNYGIAERTTDSAQVKRTITETYDFAPDAEHNDKF
jgi:hypothetical protein